AARAEAALAMIGRAEAGQRVVRLELEPAPEADCDQRPAAAPAPALPAMAGSDALIAVRLAPEPHGAAKALTLDHVTSLASPSYGGCQPTLLGLSSFPRKREFRRCIEQVPAVAGMTSARSQGSVHGAERTLTHSPRPLRPMSGRLLDESPALAGRRPYALLRCQLRRARCRRRQRRRAATSRACGS